MTDLSDKFAHLEALISSLDAAQALALAGIKASTDALYAPLVGLRVDSNSNASEMTALLETIDSSLTRIRRCIQEDGYEYMQIRIAPACTSLAEKMERLRDAILPVGALASDGGVATDLRDLMSGSVSGGTSDIQATTRFIYDWLLETLGTVEEGEPPLLPQITANTACGSCIPPFPDQGGYAVLVESEYGRVQQSADRLTVSPVWNVDIENFGMRFTHTYDIPDLKREISRDEGETWEGWGIYLMSSAPYYALDPQDYTPLKPIDGNWHGLPALDIPLMICVPAGHWVRVFIGVPAE